MIVTKIIFYHGILAKYDNRDYGRRNTFCRAGVLPRALFFIRLNALTSSNVYGTAAVHPDFQIYRDHNMTDW